jgi:signal transduction histidine kinase
MGKPGLQILKDTWSFFLRKFAQPPLSNDYITWRQEFMRQRVRLCLWIAIVGFFTFSLRTIYDAIISPLWEMQNIPQDSKTIFWLINVAIGCSLLTCPIWHKILSRRHPEIMFLILSWSVTLMPQFVATIKGIAFVDRAGWALVFTSQATLVPVCWQLHLISQLVVLGYYFTINPIFGFTTLTGEPSYSISSVLIMFWFCFACDLGVYLYERLQKAEFASRRDLRVFLHSVSHDLKNPVMGTSMVVQNLLQGSQDKVTIDKSVLERLQQVCDRQLNLINSLLEAHETEVRGIPLHCQPVKLSSLVKDVLTDLEPVLSKNSVIIANKIPADLPLVNADATQLWRVFSNLITNAITHNPPGIIVTLDAEVVEEGGMGMRQKRGTRENKEKIPNYPLPITHSPFPKPFLYCIVQDNGVGIPPNQCDRLFELYARGSRARYMPGLGFGLYLCRQIITAHKGEIGVNSHVGSGSTFWFTLPL